MEMTRERTDVPSRATAPQPGSRSTKATRGKENGVNSKRGVLAMVLGVLVMAAGAGAATIPVGTGNDHSTVIINFEDGAKYEFDVAYTDDGTQTGVTLLDIIEADLASFSTVQDDFGFGLFVDGITHDGHSNAGFGGGELWWHYYIKDSAADAWVAPQTFGASGRDPGNGTWDGWVYGSAEEPVGTGAGPGTGADVPEPATLVLVSLGVLAVGRRWRRRRA